MNLAQIEYLMLLALWVLLLSCQTCNRFDQRRKLHGFAKIPLKTCIDCFGYRFFPAPEFFITFFKIARELRR
ncbi:hypothetical protein SAMN05216404_11718 [Nitrosospira multiformis]|uniref:Uncharacterized protein n=1 Tax=Nitrosospira multiformis TaxID=1231 RepID=A0A1H8NN56_9PROT|nr:hypothetical protein SAMN05216404_11718 [Nitrosospira multiformis]